MKYFLCNNTFCFKGKPTNRFVSAQFWISHILSVFFQVCGCLWSWPRSLFSSGHYVESYPRHLPLLHGAFTLWITELFLNAWKKNLKTVSKLCQKTCHTSVMCCVSPSVCFSKSELGSKTKKNKVIIHSHTYCRGIMPSYQNIAFIRDQIINEVFLVYYSGSWRVLYY